MFARSTQRALQTPLSVATATDSGNAGEHHTRHRVGRRPAEAPPGGLQGLLDGEIGSQHHNDSVSFNAYFLEISRLCYQCDT